VPMVLTLWPPILMGLYALTSRRNDVEAGNAREGRHE
jgi:hypothetical protein